MGIETEVARERKRARAREGAVPVLPRPVSLQITATHYNTLQHTVQHTLQHTLQHRERAVPVLPTTR